MISVGCDVVESATNDNRLSSQSNSVACIWVKSSRTSKCPICVMPVPLSTYLLSEEQKFVAKELEIMRVRRTAANVDVKNLSTGKRSV